MKGCSICVSIRGNIRNNIVSPPNMGSPLEGNAEIATQMRRIAFAVLWNYLFRCFANNEKL